MTRRVGCECGRAWKRALATHGRPTGSDSRRMEGWVRIWRFISAVNAILVGRAWQRGALWGAQAEGGAGICWTWKAMKQRFVGGSNQSRGTSKHANEAGSM
jgi:hypothetical protein